MILKRVVLISVFFSSASMFSQTSSSFKQQGKPVIKGTAEKNLYTIAYEIASRDIMTTGDETKDFCTLKEAQAACDKYREDSEDLSGGWVVPSIELLIKIEENIDKIGNFRNVNNLSAALGFYWSSSVVVKDDGKFTKGDIFVYDQSMNNVGDRLKSFALSSSTCSCKAFVRCVRIKSN